MESIFNGLIQFESTSQFEAYLNSIEKNDALKLIELGLFYGQKNGLYTMEESHCLYLSLKKIKETKNETARTKTESEPI